ncbi:MAG TPA: glycosyl hydrolase family 25 [Prevotella sp.]|nr:glycosyl hydrolase family 25 [Prevotella sp.]
MNRNAIAQGWGKYFAPHRSYYEGTWKNNRREGFGYSIKPHHKIRAGEWKNDRYYGERVNYTSNRIYGIDISKYQHLAGRRLVSINWKQVKIIGLGQLSRKKITGTINYKISFAYIKSTEGRSLYNTFYHTDYTHAKAAGIKVGTYHYFSTTSSASQQAYFFLKHSIFHYGDFPPVLDVEPLPSQIKKMGGISELFNRIRTWLYIVERKTGTRPILYISQIFVNRYLPAAPDIRHNYQIWIARYGEYKPDVRLAYWQLSPDGRVKGIHGIVDINVFNGYHGEFEDFIHSYCIK